MMVALSHLLRSSLSADGERVPLEQELQFTRDYLDLQHMRFEDRLVYDLHVDARPDVRVPSFILQPLVENAVIHGMADRSEPTRVHVAVREVARRRWRSRSATMGRDSRRACSMARSRWASAWARCGRGCSRCRTDAGR